MKGHATTVGVGILVAAALPMALSAQTIDDVVDCLEPLFLEETPEALNESPRLGLDPEGGFLVTDPQAAQVRLYDPDGTLLLYFGREGQGPGEFRQLRGAARLSTGEICTVDFEGRLALWSREGELLDDRRLPIVGALGVAPMAGHRLAVVTAPAAARPDSMDLPWVRFLDVERFEGGSEVLAFPLTRQNLSSASAVGVNINPTLGRKFGLTWSIYDSLWVVDLERPSDRKVVQLESALLGLNTMPVDRFEDRQGFIDWMLSATFPDAAFPAPGGGWLVALFRREPRPEGTWGLLRVDDEGRRVWELGHAPRLVASDPAEGVLYFAEPTGLIPNRFDRARMKN